MLARPRTRWLAGAGVLAVVVAYTPFAFAAAGDTTKVTPADASVLDTTALDSTTYLALGDIKLAEVNGSNPNSGIFGIGTVILDAPAGFAFRTAANATVSLNSATNLSIGPKVGGTCVTGGGSPLSVAPTAPTSAPSAPGQLAFRICGRSNSTATHGATITISGLRVYATTTTVPTTGKLTLDSAGTATFTDVTLGTNAAATSLGNLTETADVASSLAVSTASSTVAGVAKDVTVTAKDTAGNTVTTYLGTVHLTSSDGAAVLAGNSALTSGTKTFANGMTLKTVGTGTQSITATDVAAPSITGAANVTVTPAAVSTLSVSGVANPVSAGASQVLTVSAQDQFSNVVTGYLGKVDFTSDDPSSQLPASYQFVSGDNGLKTFNGVQLRTVGTRSVTATDHASSALHGAQTGITVNPATAASLAWSGLADGTAGVAQSPGVTAKDAYGNTATGYLGTVHFGSDDAQAGLPANSSYQGTDAGTKGFTVTPKTAGSKTFTVTDSVTGTIAGSKSIAVQPAASTKFVVSGYPTTTTAGVAHNFVVTAQDAYGNTDTAYAGPVHLTSSDGQAALPADTTLTNGVGTLTATLKSAGSQGLTVTDVANSAIAGSQGNISVSPASAASIVVAQLASPATAGVAGNVTVTAKDAYGNTATGYAGTLHFTASDAHADLPNDATLTNGTGTFPVTLKTAGVQDVTASDGTLSGSEQGITVYPADASALQLTGLADHVTAGGAAGVTVTAIDDFGNTVTGFAGTVHFASTDGAASVPADYAFLPGDNGQHDFTVTAYTAGARTITATAGALSGDATTTVDPALASQLTAGLSGGTAPADAARTLTVTARDAYGNVAPDYVGTVHVVSTDAHAVLPDDTALGAADAGQRALDVTLRTVGQQTVTASVVAGSALADATSDAVSVTPAAASHLQVTGLLTPFTAGDSQSVTVTAKDAWGNTDTNYAGTVHLTSTDPHAVLADDHDFVGGDQGSAQLPVSLHTVGAHDVTATDAADSTVSGAQTNVAVTPGALSAITLSPSETTASSGVPVEFGVAGYDAYGNATGDVSDATYTVDGDACDTNSCAAAAVGDHTVSAVYDGHTSTATLHIVAGPVNAVGLNLDATSVAAGGTTNATVTVTDAGGNPLSGLTPTISSTGGALAADAVDNNDGTYTFSITAGTVAGVETLTADVGGVTATEDLTTTPADVSTMSITQSKPSLVANGADELTMTLAPSDAYGNLRAGDPVALTCDGCDVSLGAVSDNGDGTYSAVVTAGHTPGILSVTATDGTYSRQKSLNIKPVLVINSVDATTVGQGAVSRTVNVYGDGFTKPSQITSGSTADLGDGTTTEVKYLSPQQLRLRISAAPDAAVGPRDLVITTDNGQTATFSGMSIAAAPTGSDLSPSSFGQGAIRNDLVLSGANFTDGMKLKTDGVGVHVSNTGIIDSTHMSVWVKVDSDAPVGTQHLGLINPDGGNSTCSCTVTVLPAPVVSAVSPLAVGPGGTATLTISGANFQPSAKLSMGPSVALRNMTVESDHTITVEATVATTALPGSRDVTVTNSKGEVKGSCACFTISAGPVLSNVTPSANARNSTKLVTIDGAGFAPNAVVTLDKPGFGIGAATVNADGTQLAVAITVPQKMAVGQRKLTITNPDGGRGSGVITIT